MEGLLKLLERILGPGVPVEKACWAVDARPSFLVEGSLEEACLAVAYLVKGNPEEVAFLVAVVAGMVEV